VSSSEALGKCYCLEAQEICHFTKDTEKDVCGEGKQPKGKLKAKADNAMDVDKPKPK